MPLTFLQPLQLVNALESEALTFNYSYDAPSSLKCLFDNCANLGGNTTYVSAAFPNAAPDRYGCWFPTVNNQSDLNNNFTRIEAGAFRKFLFFKAVGSLTVLHETDTLTTGFANGTPVPVEDMPTERITTVNFGGVRLRVQDVDGPVIIVGIMDIGGPIKG
jgi:hypothetical protein